jgi:hypothetical protein
MKKRRLRHSLSAVVGACMLLTAASASAAPINDVPVVGTVADRAFSGTLRIDSLSLGEDGQLLASGRLRGAVSGVRQNVRQDFVNAPLALGPSEPGVCDILFLDLGPLFLDVLGLTVDLSAVQLDIDALPGAGNLLGNLLCAVTGLLDFDPSDILSGILNNILDAINEILS